MLRFLLPNLSIELAAHENRKMKILTIFIFLFFQVNAKTIGSTIVIEKREFGDTNHVYMPKWILKLLRPDYGDDYEDTDADYEKRSVTEKPTEKQEKHAIVKKDSLLKDSIKLFKDILGLEEHDDTFKKDVEFQVIKGFPPAILNFGKGQNGFSIRKKRFDLGNYLDYRVPLRFVHSKYKD